MSATIDNCIASTLETERQRVALVGLVHKEFLPQLLMSLLYYRKYNCTPRYDGVNLAEERASSQFLAST